MISKAEFDTCRKMTDDMFSLYLQMNQRLHNMVFGDTWQLGFFSGDTKEIQQAIEEGRKKVQAAKDAGFDQLWIQHSALVAHIGQAENQLRHIKVVE